MSTPAGQPMEPSNLLRRSTVDPRLLSQPSAPQSSPILPTHSPDPLIRQPDPRLLSQPSAPQYSPILPTHSPDPLIRQPDPNAHQLGLPQLSVITPPTSVAKDSWGCRDGENILVESRTKSHFTTSKSVRRYDLRIFELHQRYGLPNRRIALRYCAPTAQCISHCKTS